MPARDDSAREEAVQRRPGRLRAAWMALLGHPVVPDQIRAEWAQAQLVFHDLLTQLSASLARQARAEKKRIERLRERAQEASEGQPLHRRPPDLASRKAALRRFAFHGEERPSWLNGSQVPLDLSPEESPE